MQEHIAHMIAAYTSDPKTLRKEDIMSKIIRLTETVLRDGQQSQIATRMSTEDMLPILETLDQAG